MLPRLKADIGVKEVLAAFSILTSSKKSVIDFEAEFSSLLGQRSALAFPYGRTGLVALLKAMKIEGEEIICPAYTCVVVPHAVVTAGFTPVFVDSQESDFNMDWACVERAVGPNTGAVIATSIFGSPVDLDALSSFREKHPEVKVIQDCAHSFSAEWKGVPVQSAGDAAFFGLNVSKIMTSIFGGMVTTDDPLLANELAKVRSNMLSPASQSKSLKRLCYLLLVVPAFQRTLYGLVNRLERLGVLNRFVKYYDESIIEMPSDYLEPMSDVEARVGIIQCSKYQYIVSHRRELAKIYTEGLSGVRGLKLPPMIEGATFSHYVVRANYSEEIIAYLLERGIQLGELIDYHIPSMSSYSGCKYFGMGRSECWPGSVVNLPVHTGCGHSDAERIVKNIRECLKSVN